MADDMAKLAACPAPKTLTNVEAVFWRDLVCRLPLGCVPKAHAASLALYCKLSVRQRRLAQQRKPDITEISKIARVLRSTALRLSLPALLRQESRSDEGALAAVASDVQQAWNHPDHCRAGLMGVRVQVAEEIAA